MDLLDTVKLLALDPTCDINDALREFPEELKTLYIKSDFIKVRQYLSNSENAFTDMSHCLPFPDMSHGLTINQ